MKYCRAEKYNLQLLLNDPSFSSEPTSETYTSDSEESMMESILDFNDREMDNQKNTVSFS